jgi:CheY-like chemotaxis protein
MARILVADDNRQFADIVGAMLEDAGHSVVTAYSGRSALAAAEQAPVDAAVLDVLIPQISGDAVAQRLRQMTPGLPIVLMTGGDPDFAAAAGLPVLQKPFTREDLVETVDRLVAR